MNLLQALLQSLLAQHTHLESHALLEKAKATAEKSKRIAFFSAASMLALVYLVAASLVAAVECGLQYERGEFIRWSGLFATSLGLSLLAGLILLIGAWVLGAEKRREAAAPPPPPPRNELREALESVAVAFLKQLADNLNKPESDS